VPDNIASIGLYCSQAHSEWLNYNYIMFSTDSAHSSQQLFWSSGLMPSHKTGGCSFRWTLLRTVRFGWTFMTLQCC